MANQFSVTPLGGLDVGTKLTQVIQGGRQQYRIKQMQEKAPEVFQTGDPTQIANFMIEYPEMADTMNKAMGFQEIGQTKEIVDVAKGLLTPGSDPKEVIAQYATKLKDSNRDPRMAVSMLTKVMQDPAQSEEMAKKLLAIHSPQELVAYQKIIGEQPTMQVAGIQEFEYLTEGLPEEEKKKAQRIKLGLDPRASESAEIKANKAFATEVAKLSAKLDLEPQVAGAVAAAKNQAKVESDIAVKDRSNEAAWNVYNSAMDNLSRALTATTTFPGMGFIPAMTANAQIAKGAIAIMAPVLKDTFRAAGEGTFTKDDQQVLMGMLPDMNDLPKTIIAKITAVDNQVRLKLGITGKGDVLPEGVTEEDIQLTMKNHNMTREEVLTRLKGG